MFNARSLLTALLALAGLAAVFLALGRWLPARGPAARPLPVPDGDQEIAWLHTSTSASTWERFVAGVQRVPGFEVDDSRAFLDRTTSIPEVVLGRPERPGKLRIRWYKLTSEAGSRQWVDALAQRSPPPLAVIGGGSTDRAVDLARALQDRTAWNGGSRPLFLLTTATANEVYIDDEPAGGSVGLRSAQDLMRLYPGRSFRFCFTNEQMAQAVIDFVRRTPDLRPQAGVSALAAALGVAAAVPVPGGLVAEEGPARVFALEWGDDPYSVDLAEHFRRAVHESPLACRVQVSSQGLPYSVGESNRPTRYEAEAVEQVLAEAPARPGSRSLLVLPTTAPPARRVLRALTCAAPLIGENLVAVTGDGISFNVIYRDADFLWPLRDLPVPLVLFTHQNPVAWEREPAGPRDGRAGTPTRGALLPPNSTEDVLLFGDLVRRVAEAAYTDAEGLVADADTLATRLRAQEPPFFDADGNRSGGRGEYVICLRPHFTDNGQRVAAAASLEVWVRRDGANWELVERFLR